MRLLSRLPNSRPLHYGIACLAVLLAAGARMLLDPLLGDREPFVTFVIAVLIAILYTSKGASLLAFLLALATAKYLFIAPRFSLAVADPADLLDLGLYSIAGLLAIDLIHEQRRARYSAEASVADALAKRSALEEEMRERRRIEEALRDREMRLRAIIEGEPECVKVVGLDGTLLEMNPAGLLMVEAASARDVIGKPVINLIHPEDRPAFQAFHSSVSRGAPGTLEFRIVGLRGSMRWMGTHAVPLRNQSGEITSVLSITRDITERKLAEKALRTSEQQFSGAFESAAIGMALVAPDGRWLKVNHSLCDLTGYSAEELLSKTFQDITHPDDLERDLGYVRQMLAGEIHTYHMEKRYFHKLGHTVWILLSVSLVRDAQGQPVHFVAQIQDITERRQAGEELRTKTEQLQVISEAMTQFLEDGDWRGASARMLRAALNQTESEYGFIGVVVEGPVLRILAYEGIVWDAMINREFYESALRTYQEKGYLEFTNLNNLFGRVITAGAIVISNEPGTDPRSGGLPPGHPPLRHFMGVPIVRGTGVVGLIGVANRRNGYTGAEQAKIEILTQAVGVLYDSYVRHEREADLEAQLRQAQKMEAIGRLAGGIAHDFNNFLMVINWNSKLVLDQYRADDRLQSTVQLIMQAGESAGALVRQILAFSRKQVLVPAVVDLNAVITGMSTLLQRFMGEDIDLATDLDEAIGHVKADGGQLEQVIMNLVVNARDAMPQGGKLTIETRNRDITETNRHGQIVRLGRYVTLSVSDTGCGMDSETQARIFEPFFTTKEQGKGTGLGLSTVYGIVKQSGGYVFVYSEPGRGSTFRIYLPRVDEAVGTVARPPAEPVPVTGTETILLVEDEPSVRALIRDTLMRHGYTVREARHGVEALLVANQESAPIHLLLTDVVMPQMSGRELAERLMPANRDLKVLYMSGYTDAAVVHHGVLDPGTAFLQKPFEAPVLLRTVREVLDIPRKP